MSFLYNNEAVNNMCYCALVWYSTDDCVQSYSDHNVEEAVRPTAASTV